MPLITLIAGNKVAIGDVNQLIAALTGSAAHPITLSQDYGALYPLTIYNANSGTGNIATLGGVGGTMLLVTKNGVEISVDGTVPGVAGDRKAVNVGTAQALKNKTIDGALNTLSNIPSAALGLLSVITAAIADLAVTTAKIANDAVTGIKLGTVEGCQVRKTSTQTFSPQARTIITWNSEDWDSNALHDVVTNNSRITIKTAGLYQVQVGLFFAATQGLDDMDCFLYKNGVSTQLLYRTTNNPWSGVGSLGLNASFLIRAVVNDYFEVSGYHYAGNSSQGITAESWFAMTRVGA